ncbi:MAG: arylsulfatase [Blastomonas sp.]
MQWPNERSTRFAALICAAALCLIPGQHIAAQPDAPDSDTAADYVRTAPQDAPNIVIVLLDDVGFGASSTFGGVIETPTLDALAAQGLRYNRFHTTAICSPTRASLLTGRNPHATGIGAVMNVADARPGYSGYMGRDTASIARILQQNGYATGAFGKWHQTPDWEISPAGPFDRWPTGQGFDRFYGFQGGETDQYDPTLYDGTRLVMRPDREGYHLTEDLADQSISWMRQVRASDPKKPFFLYFSTGGIHAPVQVPRQWIDPYRGKFDMGWDQLREIIFDRQKQLGVIPPDTQLTARPDIMPAWDSLSAEQKKFSARLMEAYAGFLAHTDAQVGKLVAELKERGEFDNTLFIYIVGDNGASAEGSLTGSLDYMGSMFGVSLPQGPETLARIDDIGMRGTYAHINAQWAWATDAPFQWTKTIASHLGGTRNGLVVSWPGHIGDEGGLRSQFGHVNDIAPTILDVLGLLAPDDVDGVAQKPMDGTSLAYTFTQPDAPERHTTQYFEVFGHRAIYHDGWMASAFHARLPWMAYLPKDPPLDDDVWELYDLRSDFSQARNLAASHPDKLAELKALFMAEAKRSNALPLRGQVLSKHGLPDPSHGRTTATYLPGTIGIPEVALPSMLGKSWSVEAKLFAGDTPQGVIAALGGTDAGLALFIDAHGRPSFAYRLYDRKNVLIAGKDALAPGEHEITVLFRHNGKGPLGGGDLVLMVDGKAVGQESIPATPPQYSIHETFGVGIDSGAPVGPYPDNAAPGFPLKDARIIHVKLATE